MDETYHTSSKNPSCYSEVQRFNKMNCHCNPSAISSSLSVIFSKLGRNIGKHPCIFITIPMLLSVSMSVGIQKLSINRDVYDMLIPDNGKVFEIKKFIEKVWNSSENSDEVRFAQIPNSLVIIFMKKEGGNMLEKETLLEIKKADELIKNATIKAGNTTIGYTDLCAIMRGRCYENPIIEVAENIDDTLAKRYRFKYPLDINNLSYSFRLFAMNLGGVKTDGEDFVNSIEAIKLNYYFEDNNAEKKKRVMEWSDLVYETIENYHFEIVRSILNSFWSIEKYSYQLTEKLKPMIAALTVFVCVFAVLTNMNRNLIRSKPWLGIAAVTSAGLATLTSFGLLGLLGVENSYCNICIPFLILVTETDDAYVLIACWKTTNPTDNVEKRMADTYSEGGISIFLTSLTNIFSYCIGMMASFPVVRVFCYYSAICILFTFFFQITFFGGCMALSGYREEKRIHPFIFRSYALEDSDIQEKEEDFFMKLFRDKLGIILSSAVMKIFIIILYFVNLGSGIWGALSLRQGFDAQKIYPYDSTVSESVRIYYKYFAEYSFPIHIIINKTLDYSDINVQKSVEERIERFESLPHVAESRFTASWLKFYKEFQAHPVAKFSLNGYNMSNKIDFVDGLRNVFLKFKAAEQFSKDVVFSEDGSDIVCSRFFVVTKEITNREIEVETLKKFWKIAEESPFPVLIHCIFSDFIEQGLIIKDMLYQLFWITSILILIIYFSVISNLICAFVVSVSVVSIIIGTVGYMSMWDINLDIFSLLSLILCVGFCFNYPAHISYAFVMSSYERPNEKLMDALYRISFPIFQGSLSNILGILFMYDSTYLTYAFIKIVFIISIQTAFHAAFVIPVILSLIYEYFGKYFKKNGHVKLILTRDCHFVQNKEILDKQ